MKITAKLTFSNQSTALSLTSAGLLDFKALTLITCFGGLYDLSILFIGIKKIIEANPCHITYGSSNVGRI